MQLAMTFNQQFNTSKLGRYTSSNETRLVTRGTNKKPLEMAQTFTADLVMRAINSCRNSYAFGPTNSATTKVNIDEWTQGSKLSPSMFIFYIADMPRCTEQVKRVHYTDDLTVWDTRVNIPDLDVSLNRYIEQINAYLQDNSLLISAPNAAVTLLTPDTRQTKTHPRIIIEDSQLSLFQCPKILGVHLDSSLSFNKHGHHVEE